MAGSQIIPLEMLGEGVLRRLELQNNNLFFDRVPPDLQNDVLKQHIGLKIGQAWLTPSSRVRILRNESETGVCTANGTMFFCLRISKTYAILRCWWLVALSLAFLWTTRWKRISQNLVEGSVQH